VEEGEEVVALEVLGKMKNDNERKPEGSLNNLDRRLNNTLKSVQGYARTNERIAFRSLNSFYVED
jgi:hypothetical protein